MRDFLTELGIEKQNQGASDGEFFDTSGFFIDSLSPVDGQIIAKPVRRGEIQNPKSQTNSKSPNIKPSGSWGSRVLMEKRFRFPV